MIRCNTGWKMNLGGGQSNQFTFEICNYAYQWKGKILKEKEIFGNIRSNRCTCLQLIRKIALVPRLSYNNCYRTKWGLGIKQNARDVEITGPFLLKKGLLSELH